MASSASSVSLRRAATLGLRATSRFSSSGSVVTHPHAVSSATESASPSATGIPAAISPNTRTAFALKDSLYGNPLSMAKALIPRENRALRCAFAHCVNTQQRTC